MFFFISFFFWVLTELRKGSRTHPSQSEARITRCYCQVPTFRPPPVELLPTRPARPPWPRSSKTNSKKRCNSILTKQLQLPSPTGRRRRSSRHRRSKSMQWRWNYQTFGQQIQQHGSHRQRQRSAGQTSPFLTLNMTTSWWSCLRTYDYIWITSGSPDVVVRNLTCSSVNETPWFETECLFIKNIWFGNEQAKTTNNLLIIIKK